MGIRGTLLIASTLFGFCSVAEPIFPVPTPAPQNAWSQVAGPAAGSPTVIGFYSAGCIRGAKQLASEGPGYQSMRLSRNRQYGHPTLIDFITGLAQRTESLGSALLISDLGQARGGPMPYGHNSHQVGLDVDVWFWTHPEQRMRSLSLEERDNLPMVSMLNANGIVDPKRFGAEQILKLKLASLSPEVERIFVNPAIKTYLCSVLEESELSWLDKLRPWPGHHEHFHVRIRCPEGSAECIPQEAPPPGDGCHELLPPRRKLVLKSEENPWLERFSENTFPEACTKLLKE
jgi:penicillin-insensitive murein endopeptidase